MDVALHNGKVEFEYSTFAMLRTWSCLIFWIFGTECRKWTLGVSTCYFFCYCFATRGWSIWSKRNFPLGNFLYWNFHSYNLNGNEIFCHETHNEVVEFSLREFSVMEYFIFHGIFFFPRIKIFSFMELLSNGIVFQGIFCHGIIFSWNSLFLGIKIFSWNFQIHGKSFSWNLFSWNFLRGIFFPLKKSHGKFLQSYDSVCDICGQYGG